MFNKLFPVLIEYAIGVIQTTELKGTHILQGKISKKAYSTCSISYVSLVYLETRFEKKFHLGRVSKLLIIIL